MTVRILEGDCVASMRALILAGVRVQTIVTSPPYFGLRQYIADGAPEKVHEIGLEESPLDYIAKLVEVFDVSRELLADDGTLWLNIGDSYAANRTYQVRNTAGAAGHTFGAGSKVPDGLKPKELIGIPWRLAFALQDAGWYLRQDIIWSKPNPMPESVLDRCTKAHEYLFLLSKQPRYYFDAAAIAEPANYPQGSGNMDGNRYVLAAATDGKHRTKAGLAEIGPRDTRNKRSVWTVATQPFNGSRFLGDAVDGSGRIMSPDCPVHGDHGQSASTARGGGRQDASSAGKCSCKTIDHFATFPPALIEPCILACSRPGDLVLDPFGGAGTTGLVADRLDRSAILCELNPDYAAMARRRIFNDAPLFVDVT